MKIKKILSYIWPQTITVPSDCNGVLEITYINGRKVLDSKNANYSYGSLQKILEKGLSKIDLKETKSVLILGLGGGCVLKSLADKFNYKGHITAVELDAKMIEIAKSEFLIEENKNLSIINEDAFTYMKKEQKQYDFIIVDLFIDQKVPNQFYSKTFCDYLYQSISRQGSLLFNLGLHSHNLDCRNNVVQYFKEFNCDVFQYQKVLKTNTLLVVNKK